MLEISAVSVRLVRTQTDKSLQIFLISDLGIVEMEIDDMSDADTSSSSAAKSKETSSIWRAF